MQTKILKTVDNVISTYCKKYPGISDRIHEIAKEALEELPGTATEEEKADQVEGWLCAEL